MKLRAEGIEKSYKGRKVVKGISLEVTQGEIVGLLGPQWSGKDYFFLHDRRTDQTQCRKYFSQCR